MKKTSLWIILVLILLLSSSTLSLVACKNNEPAGGDNILQSGTPTEGLSPQQQVDIAIESLTAMRDVCLADNTATAISLANENSDSKHSTSLDDLFAMLDRNQTAFTPNSGENTRSVFWAVFSIALLDALQQYGTDCLDHDITPTYTFTGDDSSLAQSTKEFFPNKIRFLGTMEEDGKKVIYASVLISLEDVDGALTFWYDLKTYYIDDAHFGYSLLRTPIIYPEYDYRSGDLFSYYDSAAPQRFLEIEAEKMQGQSNGIILYADTICNDFSAVSEQDLQVMFDFLDDAHATFPQSDTREILSTTMSVNLKDVINMR